ncbi:MAG: RsmG family class I SAM-dependent methyltransferase [Candidatus Binataceae bacterium]
MKPSHPRPDPRAVAAEARSIVEAAIRTLDASAIAPAFLDRMTRFAENLAIWGARTNLTARPGDPAEVAFHIIDSLTPVALESEPAAYPLRAAFGRAARVLDVGSGAGFPGLVLASASSAAHFTLVESRRKRVSFLRLASAAMELANVAIEQKHLAPADLNGDFDIAIGRALGPPADFYAIAVAALRNAGIAILYANPDQRLDLPAAAAFGLGAETRVSYALRRGETSVSRILVLWRKL